MNMKTKITLFALLLFSTLVVQAQTIMNIHQSNGTVLQIPLNTIDSITYTIPNPGNLATITTTAITSITGSTAVSGGNVSNDGGTLVTQRGICYSTSSSPTTANTTIISGSGIGSFSSNLTSLTANTNYYVRAYATNSAGTAYGNEVSFTTTVGIISNPGTGVTFDGYTYSSMVLGNGQEWMAENLRTTSYANGDPIPNVTDNTQWQGGAPGAWVHYNNDSQYENPYGKLYNWYTVADPRNVCPTGWHVPSDAEWTVLSDYLGGQVVAGGKMKSTGTAYWGTPNTGATNESGFSGLPGGYRGDLGIFSDIGGRGDWWSTSEENSGYALYKVIIATSSNFYSLTFDKRDGKSVRCLRD